MKTDSIDAKLAVMMTTVEEEEEEEEEDPWLQEWLK